MSALPREEYNFDQIDRQFLYANSHIVLYSRGVYKISNIYNDLKKIISAQTGKDKEKVTDTEVFETILKIFLCVSRRNDASLLFNTLNIFQDRDTVGREEVTLRLLRGISQIGKGYQVEKPNYNILDQPEG